MKIVLDTNVMVSAFATRGLCSDIFELCLAEHRIVLSHFLIEEIVRNLIKKVKLPQSIASNIQEFLSTETEIVKPVSIPQDTCRDKTDLKVLGTAVAGGVEAIVTGDNDLLIVQEFRSIRILSPRKFWYILQDKALK